LIRIKTISISSAQDASSLNRRGRTMSYATLMVHLELGRTDMALLKIARDLAERLHAGVTGVAVCQPMRIIHNDGYVPGDIIERDRNRIDNEIKAADAEFRLAMADRVAAVEWRSNVV
jgi:hypothetical protein